MSPALSFRTDVEEDITMVLKGKLTERMVEVAPNLYRK